MLLHSFLWNKRENENDPGVVTAHQAACKKWKRFAHIVI